MLRIISVVLGVEVILVNDNDKNFFFVGIYFQWREIENSNKRNKYLNYIVYQKDISFISQKYKRGIESVRVRMDLLFYGMSEFWQVYEMRE